jgi:hypothetical protein
LLQLAADLQSALQRSRPATLQVQVVSTTKLSSIVEMFLPLKFTMEMFLPLKLNHENEKKIQYNCNKTAVPVHDGKHNFWHLHL